MENMEDYVRFIANSMNKDLTERSIKELTYELLDSKLYEQLLHTLELRIKAEAIN